MCYRNYYTSDSKKDFPDEMLDLILDEAKELNIPSIIITGGEPTMHPRISDILKKIGMAGFLNIWLPTNGSKLNNEKFLETITDIPLTGLSVSLDAATPETYKKIRGGDLNTIERNIELFLKFRSKKKSQLPLFRVSFIDMLENRHELKQFIEKWENIADIIDIQTYSDMNPNKIFTGYGGLFKCDQPYKRIMVDQNGELRPCFFAQYQVSDPIFFGKDYITLMDYWNSDWHNAFCDNHVKEQYNDVCARCRGSFIKYSTT
jgi:MoaA/NifB/PqqE/SkfB family radical SAM enzyme